MAVQQPRFFIFQYTPESRTDRLLQRNEIGGTVDWIYSRKSLEAQPGDIVFFLRAAGKNAQSSGITGFGEIASISLRKGSTISDDRIPVRTTVIWINDPISPYTYWHDWRLAGCNAVRGIQGTNFEISELNANALIEAIERGPSKAHARGSLEIRSLIGNETELDGPSRFLVENKIGVTRSVGDILNIARTKVHVRTDQTLNSDSIFLSAALLGANGTHTRRAAGKFLRCFADTCFGNKTPTQIANTLREFAQFDPTPIPNEGIPAQRFSKTVARAIEFRRGKSTFTLSPSTLMAPIIGRTETNNLTIITRQVMGRPMEEWVLELMVRWKASGATIAELKDFAGYSGFESNALKMTREEAQQWVEDLHADGLDTKEGDFTDEPIEDSSDGREPARSQSIPEIFKSEGLQPDESSDDTLGDEDLDQFSPQSGSWISGQTPSIATAMREYHSTEFEDALGCEEEAEAFARLMGSSNFKPPLAVGVFGEWGSGKTFFMELIQRHLEKLSNGNDVANDDDKPKTPYVENIIQIEFNAWHYMETNIWASLVERIFSSISVALHKEKANQDQHSKIDQLFDNMLTAQTQKVSALENWIRKKKNKETAQKAVQEAAKNAPSYKDYWTGIWTSLTSPNGPLTPDENGNAVLTKAQIDKAVKDLGFTEDSVAFAQAIEELRNTGDETKLLGRTLIRKMSSFTWLLCAAFLLIGAGLFFYLLLPSLPYLKSWFTPYFQSAGVLSTAIMSATGWVRSANKKTRIAVNQITKLETVVAAVESRDTHEAKAELARAEDNLKDASQAYETAELAVVQATDALASHSVASRLMEFVKQREGEGGYGDYLGLIATIRKDFKYLSGLMCEQGNHGDRDVEEFEALKIKLEALKSEAGSKDSRMHEKIESVLAGIDESMTMEPDFKVPDRIVLYIDDLDRCPPEKVYEVLQAVHLFLNFPIFIAVVAVDTRWVETSLELELKDLVTNSGATPRDYLEKIIQIPYWVRSMDEVSSQTFVNSKVQHGWVDVAAAVDEFEDEPSPLSAEEVVANDVLADDNISETIEDSADEEDPIDIEPVQIDEPEISAINADSVVSDMTILEPEEIEFMKTLAPFVGGTPRRALRFVNVYKIIRSLGDENAETSDQLPSEKLGLRQAMITQLAIATGAQAVSKTYFTEIKSGKTQNLMALASTMNQHWNDEENEALKKEWWDLINCLAYYCLEVAKSNDVDVTNYNSTDADQDHIAIDKILTDKVLHKKLGDASLQAITDLKNTASIARRYTFASPHVAKTRLMETSFHPK